MEYAFSLSNQHEKIFLLLVILLGFHSAWAHDVEVDGGYYNLSLAFKTASVTYKGSSHNSFDNEYSGDIVIPETITVGAVNYRVTSLGEWSFFKCNGLTSVTIPNSVTSFGRNCFSFCTGLTSFTIPNSVKSLGENCFSGCTSLTSITIPNSVKSIGYGCFADCTSLTSVSIPNSVTNMGMECFFNCSSLISIAPPVSNLGLHFFYRCSSLTSIIIPSSVTSLEKFCFSGCSSLTSMTIPSSVKSLGEECFSGCTGLTSIAIPNSVNSLGDGCFNSCSNLASLIMFSTTPPTAEDSIFARSPLTSIYVPNDEAKALYQETTPWNNYEIVTLTPITISPLLYYVDTATHTAMVIGYDETTTEMSIPESIVVDNESYAVTSLMDKCFDSCGGA